MICCRNKYFGFYIENPLKTWWKARKYFKFPNIGFKFVWKWKMKFIDKKIADKFNIKTHNFFSKRFYFSYESLHCPYANINYLSKIIDIDISDVGWKDKYDSPRHEYDPYIYVCLFGCIGFKITFFKKWVDVDCQTQNCSMEYWEYILDYLYYNKNLRNSISLWEHTSKTIKSDNKKYKYIMPVASLFLNKQGRKEYIKQF